MKSNQEESKVDAKFNKYSALFLLENKTINENLLTKKLFENFIKYGKIMKKVRDLKYEIRKTALMNRL